MEIATMRDLVDAQRARDPKREDLRCFFAIVNAFFKEIGGWQSDDDDWTTLDLTMISAIHWTPSGLRIVIDTKVMTDVDMIPSDELDWVHERIGRYIELLIEKRGYGEEFKKFTQEIIAQSFA